VRETSAAAKVEGLKSLGAEVVKGDLRDPASLLAACRGTSEVICTVSSMPFSYAPGVNDIQSVDLEGVEHLVDAAKAVGVKHFIDTTFSGNLARHFPLSDAKRAVEQHLEESGLIYTILRPSVFMEVWLSPAVGFDAVNAKVAVYGSGDQPIAWISLKDVAQFAVESLTNPEARNCVMELGGPESLSPHQVIGYFEVAMGKKFEVMHVPPQALQAQYEGATDPMQKSFVGLFQCYADGDPIDMRHIQQTFAVKLTPVKEFIHGVLAPV
jgi:uncharacterized protein YbjT (DUF2867 family)